jgi:UDP-glucuronate decarboxylase
MKDASDVIRMDLDYISEQLQQEFLSMAGSNLLITGGAGFLGYYLVQAVLHWNNNNPDRNPVMVTVYDNFMRGTPDWITGLEDDPNFESRVHDMTNPLPADIQDFQYIIHAATIASPHYYRLHPIETMDGNINGLRFLLDYCRNQIDAGKPFHGFMYYSTSEIYGDPTPENIPTPEEYNGNVSCTGPRACYDESKRFGETLCVNYSKQYDLPVRITRPFNNFGPRSHFEGDSGEVIPKFILRSLAGMPLLVHGSGEQTRDFMFVRDTAYWLAELADVPELVGEIFNIGTGIDRSVKELATQIVELTGSESEVVYTDERPGDLPRLRADTTKIASIVDFHLPTSFEDGLTEAVAYFSAQDVPSLLETEQEHNW